jgi:hypothetical protein
MLMGGGTVCISKKPILGTEEVEYVTDILYDPELKAHYFNVGISSHALSTFNKIFHAMPKSQFLFVLENKGLGRFDVQNEIKTRAMRVGADTPLKDLTTIHKIFKELDPEKSP